MSHSQIAVVKFLFQGDLRGLTEALGADSSTKIESFAKSNEILPYLATVPAAVVIASLQEKSDLIEIANFLRVAKKVLKNTAIKFVVMNHSGDKNFEKAVIKLGIQDLIEPGINPKMFKFKLDFWIRSLKVQIKKGSLNFDDKGITPEIRSEERKSTDLLSAAWVEPLELENDIWVIRQESDCKRILSKWMVRILGPSPFIAQWTEVKSNLWRFDLKDIDKDIFLTGDGAWFFEGEQKPDFIWKENTWLMTGETFELFFQSTEVRLSRLKSRNKVLTICKNSLYAQTKESMIAASFDKNLTFKQEADNLKNLEGKGSTDELNFKPELGAKASDPHQGQNLERERTDVDYQSHYSNKKSDFTEKTHDPLSGKSSTDKINTHYELKELEQKTIEKQKKEVELARAYEVESEWGTEFTNEHKELEELVSEAEIISVLKQGSQNFSCYLDDFFEDTIIFSDVKSGLKVNEIVELNLTFAYKESNKKIKLSGEVEVIDESFATVKLSQVDVSALEIFMNLYEARQQSIHEFMKRAKGF